MIDFITKAHLLSILLCIFFSLFAILKTVFCKIPLFQLYEAKRKKSIALFSFSIIFFF